MNNTIETRAKEVLSIYRQIKRLHQQLDHLYRGLFNETAEVIKSYRDTGMMLPLDRSNDAHVLRIEADIRQLEEQLNHLRRNYSLARALGKSWENGLRSEMAFNRDTKIEYVPAFYRRFEVPKPRNIDFTLLSDINEIPVHVDRITLELREWANPVTHERRFIAFSDELNILYVKTQ
jgi:hypothetical protein